MKTKKKLIAASYSFDKDYCVRCSSEATASVFESIVPRLSILDVIPHPNVDINPENLETLTNM